MAAALVYVLTGWRDRRREAEIDRWEVMMGERAGRAAGVKRVESLPGPLMRMVDAAGGGQPLAYIELVPKIAYLAFMGSDSLNGSDHQTVVAKLEDPAPTVTAHPLPIIEGQREANTGVLFKEGPRHDGALPGRARDRRASPRRPRTSRWTRRSASGSRPPCAPR